jgi:hypothetical protein
VASVRINHGSLYARDPRGAAEHLAALAGGRVERFHPVEGAFVCLLNGDWDDALIEFYPRTVTLAHDDGVVTFRRLSPPASGGGSHFNLSIPGSRGDVERACAARGLTYAWRDWAGLLDVWLEDDLLIECVPTD